MSASMAAVAALIDALAAPVLVVDSDIRVLAANAPVCAILPSLRAGGALAFAWRAPEVLSGIDRVRLSGVAETVTWRERVPVERHYEVRIAPFLAPGLPPASVLTLSDLTEAQRVERMRSEFVANASHELRTPLASVLGFIETLQGPARDDPAARARFLAIMHEQAGRMARLIDDLLSLSRIEQNLHLRPTGPVDLAAIVRHVADTLAPLAADNQVEISIDAPGSLMVPGDRDELLRVAENLIENGIKYGRQGSGEKGHVDISLREQENHVHLAVRDSGPGIAPEHLPRLTERFYRVDAGLSRAVGGTGLGLAIVKHIMARHRGRLSIRSDLGSGSEFLIEIPSST